MKKTTKVTNNLDCKHSFEYIMLDELGLSGATLGEETALRIRCKLCGFTHTYEKDKKHNDVNSGILFYIWPDSDEFKFK